MKAVGQLCAARRLRPTMVAGAAWLLCGLLDASPALGAAPAMTAAVDQAATITVETFGTASVIRVEAPGAAGITMDGSGDALGSPVDFAQYIATRPGKVNTAKADGGVVFGSGMLPSRLPVSAVALTSGFGMRTHPLLDVRRLHAGVDLAAPVGSPIVAPSDGTVRVASWHGGYGMFVEVDHGGGIQTRYGHMSRLNVVPGQRVHAGDLLGLVGSTGLSTGPHLHYEVRVNGQPVNPLAVRARR